MCKIVLTASYCSAGISKVYTTLTQRSWVDGTTLQAFIFEASLLTDDDDPLVVWRTDAVIRAGARCRSSSCLTRGCCC